MPPVASPAHWRPLRWLVYGSLLATLILTCLWHVNRSGDAAWQRLVSHWTGDEPTVDPLEQKLRSTRLRILEHYLRSSPTPPPAAALADLHSLPNSTLATLMEWLPTKPIPRCTQLTQTTGITAEFPVYRSLIEAALLGHGAPPLNDAVAALEHLDLSPKQADFLHLLEQLGSRADATDQPTLGTQICCRIARHPLAGFEQVRTMVEHAVATDQPDLALETLRDWRDGPPASASSAETNEVSRSIARLALATGDLDLLRQELAQLQFRIDNDALAMDSSEADAWWPIVWAAAPKLNSWNQCISWLEQRLRLHPHHRLNWRELADHPPASPAYRQGLQHLVEACLAARIDSRAFEGLLHLAWLETPDALAQALPLGQRLDRLDECEQCLLRLSEKHPDPRSTRAELVQRIARTCLRDGEPSSAAALLSWHLHDQPSDSESSRMLLEWQTAELPPFRAAMVWRRHLQTHPGDTGALHRLVGRWLEAGQAHAALKELTTASQLTPALRLQALTLAMELRDTTSFQLALERTLTARDRLALPLCLEAISFSERGIDSELRQRFIARARQLHPTASSLRHSAPAQVLN